MGRLPRIRFSMASVMMLVVTAAAGSAFFVEVREHARTASIGMSSQYDLAAVGTLAVSLTAVALGALKHHSAVQMMLPATITYLGFLSVIWIAEAGYERLLFYWVQIAFALTVALPLVARRHVKAELPRGPGRTWWKRTCEAVVFAFPNMVLVVLGGFLQVLCAEAVGSFFS